MKEVFKVLQRQKIHTFMLGLDALADFIPVGIISKLLIIQLCSCQDAQLLLLSGINLLPLSKRNNIQRVERHLK